MFYETSEVKNATDTGMLYVIAKYWLTEEAHDRDPDNPYFTEEFRFSPNWFTTVTVDGVDSRDTIPDEVNAAVESRWRIAVRDRERGDATTRATITQEYIRAGKVIRQLDQRAKEPTRVDDDPNGLLAEDGVTDMRGAKHDRPGAVRP